MRETHDDHKQDSIRGIYRKFANEEAHGRSPLYEHICLQIAEDSELIDFLLTLPPPKRQPNLLLAAVRYMAKEALGWPDFKRFVLSNVTDVRALMLLRATQTNEPGRCAALLPILATLPGPLALLEVGASAGLCLFPDYYRYDYDGYTVQGPFANAQSPTFRCSVRGSVPMPAEVPQIVWRAGLDLNPVSVAKPDEVEWLEALVWPEQTERLENLRAAIEVVRPRPPMIQQGDLRTDLRALAAQAPSDATLVIMHTAVLVYLSSQEERDNFSRSVGHMANHWISNEWAGVFPTLAPEGQTEDMSRFLMMLDGQPLAWSDPHGKSLAWGIDW